MLMQMKATHADEGPACSAEMRVHASGWGRACMCRWRPRTHACGRGSCVLVDEGHVSARIRVMRACK